MYLVICIAYSTKSYQHRRGSTGFAKTRATPKSGGVKTNFSSMAIEGDLIDLSFDCHHQGYLLFVYEGSGTTLLSLRLSEMSTRSLGILLSLLTCHVQPCLS